MGFGSQARGEQLLGADQDNDCCCRTITVMSMRVL